MFGVNLMGERIGKKIVKPFEAMGEKFLQEGDFFFPEAKAFTGVEYFDAKFIKSFNGFGSRFQRFFMDRVAKKLGCRAKLDAKVYEEK